MRSFVALFTIAIVASVGAGEPERVVIHLLDPRGAIEDETTMSTQWQKREADILGMRRLNVAEAAKLKKILRKELADDPNVPFCGHSPAYAVTIKRPGKPSSMVTLCGTCGTWARNGDVKALHGKVALEYLDELLPLPDVFRSVDDKPAKILQPFSEEKPRPFVQLDFTPND